jgi:hypothetical protein
MSCVKALRPVTIVARADGPACHKIARVYPQRLNGVGRGFSWDSRCRHHNLAFPREGVSPRRSVQIREIKGRVTSRSHNRPMPACPRHHSKACSETRRTEFARDLVGLGKRRESTLCLSSGTGIASSFASSGWLWTRMGRSALEPGGLVCGWAVRGMRSAVLLPWRRRGGAVCASGLRCWCGLLFGPAKPRRQTGHRSNGTARCARLRAIATVDSKGHAHRGLPSQQSDKMERRLLSGLKAGAPNIA